MANGETKPGYKTTEFWLSLVAVIIGAVLASGLDNPVVLKVAGIAASVLTAMGYSLTRAKTKSNS